MAISKVRTSAGTTLGISAGTVTNYAAADLAALTYTQVGELSDIGSFGKKYNLVTFTPLSDRKVVKRKGSYNNGTLSLKMGSAPTDAGQVLMQAGSNSDNSYSFKVTTQAGNSYYFTGQIMSFVLEVGSVDQIMGSSAEIEIDNDIVFVATNGDTSTPVTTPPVTTPPATTTSTAGFMRLIGTQNQQVQASVLSGSYNSAVIKLQAPGGAVGARVIVTNNAPHFGMTGMKAAMASTEISACDTAANAYTPIIGGVAVNAISTTTSDKGFVKATWNGATISRRLGKSNSILPGFGYNNQEEIVVSDIIPLVPVQATDRQNPENYYILRLTGVGQSGQDGQSQYEGGTGKVANVLYNQWLNTSGADAPLMCIGGLGNTTDAVDGNIATIPGGIANGYSPVFHIEWIYPSGVTPVTFWHVGDSITEGYEWPRWAVNRKNTNRARPLHHANLGGSTTRTEAFIGEMYLHLQSTSKPDYVVMPIISVNNYSPLSSFNLTYAQAEYTRLQEVATYLTGLGIKIIWWVPFNFGANPASSDTTTAWGYIYNNAKTYASSNGITWMDINGDSRLVRSVYNATSNPTGWIDPDNTHPSNPTGKAGFATVYSETLTALGF